MTHAVRRKRAGAALFQTRLHALSDRSEVGPDGVGPHHLIVLMLDDMAVPDETAGHISLSRRSSSQPLRLR
jgi:hypothetical protein